LAAGEPDEGPWVEPAGALVEFLAAADPELVAAGLAAEIPVAAHQRGSHRAGRDHEGLGLERSKQEGQDKGHHDRLDGLATAAERVLDDVSLPRSRRVMPVHRPLT